MRWSMKDKSIKINDVRVRKTFAYFPQFVRLPDKTYWAWLEDVYFEEVYGTNWTHCQTKWYFLRFIETPTPKVKT